MSAISELLDDMKNTDRQWGSRVAFNPPPTRAQWDRFHLVYPESQLPDETIEYFNYGNGVASNPATGEPHLGTLLYPGGINLALPISPPFLQVSLPAPCHFSQQLPLFACGVFSVVQLLEGPQRGALWSGWSILDSELSGRVAYSLEHLLEQLRSLAHLGVDRFPEGTRLGDYEILPAGAEMLVWGKHRRTREDRLLDGVREEYSYSDSDEEFETITSPLYDEEFEQIEDHSAAWRQRHFPGAVHVPPPK